MRGLVTAYELAKRLDDPALTIVDASYPLMPGSAHIPGAVAFDLDLVSDSDSPYPHMLPPADVFAHHAGRLGIANENEVVVYDAYGLFSAARLWWMLRVFGHDRVRVLDGGLPKWKAENRPLSSEPLTPDGTRFEARFRPELLRTYEQMQKNLGTEQILDARAPARFAGFEPEPRPGVGTGSIPGSSNLHYKDCLKPPFGELRTQPELLSLFAGIDPTRPVVATCGSGVTACILALALFELGREDVSVYDGSWAEWSNRAA